MFTGVSNLGLGGNPVSSKNTNGSSTVSGETSLSVTAWVKTSLSPSQLLLYWRSPLIPASRCICVAKEFLSHLQLELTLSTRYSGRHQCFSRNIRFSSAFCTEWMSNFRRSPHNRRSCFSDGLLSCRLCLRISCESWLEERLAPEYRW